MYLLTVLAVLAAAPQDYDADAAAALALAAAQAKVEPVKPAEPPAAQVERKPRPDDQKDLTDAIKQRLAYRALRDWAEVHPGQLVAVYVLADPPPDGSDYVGAHCRYDAGPWDPPIQWPTKVIATFRDGQFVELRRDRISARGSVLSNTLPAGGWLGNTRITEVPTPASFPPPLAQPVMRRFAFPRPAGPLFGGRLRGGTCGPGGCSP